MRHTRLLTCNVCVCKPSLPTSSKYKSSKYCLRRCEFGPRKGHKNASGAPTHEVFGYLTDILLPSTFKPTTNTTHTPEYSFFDTVFFGAHVRCPSTSFQFSPTRRFQTSFTEQSRHLRHNLVGSAVWGLGGSEQKSSWWLNQPHLKNICQIGSFPQGFRVKIQKYLRNPPPRNKIPWTPACGPPEKLVVQSEGVSFIAVSRGLFQGGRSDRQACFC